MCDSLPPFIFIALALLDMPVSPISLDHSVFDGGSYAWLTTHYSPSARHSAWNPGGTCD